MLFKSASSLPEAEFAEIWVSAADTVDAIGDLFVKLLALEIADIASLEEPPGAETVVAGCPPAAKTLDCSFLSPLVGHVGDVDEWLVV